MLGYVNTVRATTLPYSDQILYWLTSLRYLLASVHNNTLGRQTNRFTNLGRVSIYA